MEPTEAHKTYCVLEYIQTLLGKLYSEPIIQSLWGRKHLGCWWPLSCNKKLKVVLCLWVPWEMWHSLRSSYQTNSWAAWRPKSLHSQKVVIITEGKRRVVQNTQRKVKEVKEKQEMISINYLFSITFKDFLLPFGYNSQLMVVCLFETIEVSIIKKKLFIFSHCFASVEVHCNLIVVKNANMCFAVGRMSFIWAVYVSPCISSKLRSDIQLSWWFSW